MTRSNILITYTVYRTSKLRAEAASLSSAKMRRRSGGAEYDRRDARALPPRFDSINSNLFLFPLFVTVVDHISKFDRFLYRNPTERKLFFKWIRTDFTNRSP